MEVRLGPVRLETAYRPNWGQLSVKSDPPGGGCPVFGITTRLTFTWGKLDQMHRPAGGAGAEEPSVDRAADDAAFGSQAFEFGAGQFSIRTRGRSGQQAFDVLCRFGRKRLRIDDAAVLDMKVGVGPA